ncbi:hypothetical protein BZM27_09380 [Paraburkholderia steynii]|uniref:Uncharacterized protein n=1 Tax=Paraburkholderia steynii TaxID=1245441 RepID=A0A4R0XHT7_9BURK|nr:hypothetical protein BZM27_09380 [Paraburkholderia steynii]
MKAGRRRVVFVKAPAAAPAATVSVRMPAGPVVFVKTVTPALDLLDAVDWTVPISSSQFGTLAKAAAAGEIDMSDLARASDASLCRRPVPEDLRRVVVGTHLEPIKVAGQ